MNIFCLFFIIAIVKCVNAKISGGPRGRFDHDVQYKPNNHHVSAHHAHFSYHPPSVIHFMCRHCSHFVTYPVYHGLPPTYVYKYREAGGRFSELLTGLALYNLGRAAAERWQYTHFYPVRPGEKCSMEVIDRKHIEEIKFPCFLMSSFIERSPESFLPGPGALDITSPQIDIRPFLQHNGSTLKITREQECVLWHNTTLNKERNVIACALLKEYSETMKPSGIPVYVWLPSTLALVMTIYIFGYCFCKRRIRKEKEPVNNGMVIDYCSSHY
ncbi:uncharacterized protein LOC135193385 [Vanessa tameamea]|uniref:Uncharacterized protein LOC135193385 n=1 Tax=Vanessa tameamea TaxID=334116 RepID=A0ABM4AK77_VANTA